eukprot:TRINITY_DN1666_c0_g1_i1.p1 TRINITY_DN1666_c0_g1~~TRINITY_DN1666_c0_g1_i1.p1  ORF type:complete len:483 (+),score=85.95 TRINITY_DN1666_c0_g1_i1:123-1451(+)
MEGGRMAWPVLAPALLFALLALLAAPATAEIRTDRIKDLPGMPEGSNIQQWAGYINVNSNGNGHMVFYWFVASQSKPETDPVVLVMNGGPGCSSLLSLFYDCGPYRVHHDRSLSLNEHTWNKHASMLFIDMPAEIGFSYSQSFYTSNDSQAMTNTYQFLLGFFQGFPEYNNGQPLYLAGEGYAGHYVPMVAQKIIDENKGNEFLKLKGIILANPNTDAAYDLTGHFPFLYYHMLLSAPTYEKVVSCYEQRNNTLCASLVGMVKAEIGSINPYNIYEDCIHSYPKGTTPLESVFTLGSYPVLTNCIDFNSATTYLNQQGVKTSLHANHGIRWLPCNPYLLYNVSDSVLSYYPSLIASLDILIMSGNVDSTVSTLGTQLWIDSLNLTQTTQWHPLTGSDGNVAGYLQQYGQFSLATVIGAGHMVSADKPEVSQQLFFDFVDGKL